MKKTTLIIAVMFISILSFGQLGFGIKGAVTMSSLTTDFSDIKEAAKTGWQLGAFVRVGDKLHLQPEIYFTAKAGQLEYSGIDINHPLKLGTVTQDITLNTVDIPVLVGYKIIDPPTLNVRIQAGPVASIVMNKKFEVSSDGIDPPEPSEEYKNAFKNMNWGLQLGAGVVFLFLTADLRYEIGLSNLYDKPEGAGSDDIGEFKNNVFMLSVGFKIM